MATYASLLYGLTSYIGRHVLEFGHGCRIDQLSKWEIYLNAMFLSCNGPCLPCSHAGGASFSNTMAEPAVMSRIA